MQNYQNQQQSRAPIDKGRIRVVIGNYPKKVNGQVQLDANGQAIMSNKYCTVGDVTRWPTDNGGYFDKLEFYPGFTIMELNKEGVISWDSQQQQQNPAPQNQNQNTGYQQNSYRQQRG